MSNNSPRLSPNTSAQHPSRDLPFENYPAVAFQPFGFATTWTLFQGTVMVISEQLSNVESRIVNRSFRIEIPSEFEWINRTVSYLEHHALELPWGDLVNGHRIKLSLHEALTNSIVHGNLEVSSDLKEAEESDRFTKALALRSTLSKYSSRRVQVDVDYSEHRIA
jgi:hypothetical protein